MCWSFEWGGRAGNVDEHLGHNVARRAPGAGGWSAMPGRVVKPCRPREGNNRR